LGLITNGNPITVTNVVANFGWEYVWHCHILSHEEVDMMPGEVRRGRALGGPVLSCWFHGGHSHLDGWHAVRLHDGSALATMGNAASEVGFRIERSDTAQRFAALNDGACEYDFLH